MEGQVAAATKGHHGGRPKAIDDDMLLSGRALKDKGVPVPEIAKKLTIKTGKNAGQQREPAPRTYSGTGCCSGSRCVRRSGSSPSSP
ncbi:hypothetical protein ACFV2U_12515 [Streptomyces sp. NPDC059697]|uniref:hypothetical protein n=1 Tax=Streptomyces sp. NPDC059697 TaxID=3346912 RepID=UPI00369D80E3